ncbi:DNA cytosine methyltransferase [Streptomyces sp. 1-11]|uniref:DNA cytosine methyltransferase n=1 Tax=Streptomyces sp. 1-11 TaxID=2590549 RepID=UPI0011726B01|nr:DNA (cytosine-5-)-methyltransferase [Streptomyces sp. 1-11]GEK03808.1 cytosine-specific methyltransferase [Streptomyces sp. 1-11]
MRASGPQRPQFTPSLTSIEICAGAGGQAVGLHKAGFDHLALVEWDAHAVETLKANVGAWPGWTSEKAASLAPMDVNDFLNSRELKALSISPGDLDLLAGGVPCPPFSLAGKRLGKDDERDLFPAALEIIKKLKPKAIMIENVRGILEPPEVFIDYRRFILNELRNYGYLVPKVEDHWSTEKQNGVMRSVWRRMDARYFGVPQLRPRAILVAIHEDAAEAGAEFEWPLRLEGDEATVFGALNESMYERCWAYWDNNERGELAKPGERTGESVYNAWHNKAYGKFIAPTLVGGSRKHGGADLGPTRAKRAWSALGVDAMGVANDPDQCAPERDLFRDAGPMLTVQQAAKIQGFPEGWIFQGKKTARYRQVGNAFPPPVAEAVGRSIAAVLRPEHRDDLLEAYVMDTEESSLAENSLRQMELLV